MCAGFDVDANSLSRQTGNGVERSDACTHLRWACLDLDVTLERQTVRVSIRASPSAEGMGAADPVRLVD